MVSLETVWLILIWFCPFLCEGFIPAPRRADLLSCCKATPSALFHAEVIHVVWANILPANAAAAAAPGRTAVHPLPGNSSRQECSHWVGGCGPLACDSRACDGNAGPFGPPKPGVSTSAHCLINNWQRQTNQNNLLPAAKCWSSLTPVNH